ncbi:hypothetical protein RJT34_17057 [Clitoria ternatea]|uniref:Uncharacterized protein n=1 Tax=Clitoria ternatea TaxID=43366 RepID=A0AAN9J8L1_CLITE
MCRTTERKKDPIPHSTSTSPASYIKGLNYFTEFFSRGKKGKQVPQMVSEYASLISIRERGQARRCGVRRVQRRLDPGRLTRITKDFETDRYADTAKVNDFASLIKEQFSFCLNESYDRISCYNIRVRRSRVRLCCLVRERRRDSRLVNPGGD